MGSPADDPHRCPGWWSSNEAQHEVTITRGFLLGRTAVTQEQWRAVMGYNTCDDPWRGTTVALGVAQHWRVDYPGDIGPRKPVVGVARDDALAFCAALSGMSGRTVRLPTEAEWEYACRAGSATAFSYGDDEGRLGQYAVFGRPYGSNEVVASRKPNAWGLYDMHGNVWEWVLDYYADYPESPQVDPAGPLAPSGERWTRVMRGGSSVNDAWQMRSACRHCIEETFRNSVVGFRALVEA